jgi:hypothetical protein
MDDHERRRLVVAADWAITAASRRLRGGAAEPVPVTVADVIERAADDGLAVTHAAAAGVLRERFELRGGGLGLTTDAFEAGLSGSG